MPPVPVESFPVGDTWTQAAITVGQFWSTSPSQSSSLLSQLLSLVVSVLGRGMQLPSMPVLLHDTTVFWQAPCPQVNIGIGKLSSAIPSQSSSSLLQASPVA